MKKKLLVFFVLIFTVYCLSFIFPYFIGGELVTEEANIGFLDNRNLSYGNVESSPQKDALATVEDNSSFTIKDSCSGNTIKVSQRDFLIATLGLELSPLAPEEALKAQVVAAYTFYNRSKNLSTEDYDFIYNSEAPYVYADREYFITKWGDNAEEYLKALESAVDLFLGSS